MAKKITIEMFKEIPEHVDMFEKKWKVNIRNKNVSLIKWKNKYYSGFYEIYSNEKLFHDVERYKTMYEVLKRLTELENGGQNG